MRRVTVVVFGCGLLAACPATSDLVSGASGAPDGGSPDAAEAGAPQTLAAHASGGGPIAVDGAFVYWVSETKRLVRCAVTGCAQPETVATTQADSIAAFALGDALYSLEVSADPDAGAPDAVWRTDPKDGTRRRIAVSPVRGADLMAAGATHVFWAAHDGTFGPVLYMCPTNGTTECTPTTVVKGTLFGPAAALVADDAAALWVSIDAKLHAFDVASDAGVEVSPLVSAAAVSGTRAIWAKRSGSSVDLLTGSLPAFAPTTVATGIDGLDSVAVDADGVYFTTQTGKVGRAELDGGELRAIAAGEPKPRFVATDGAAVYWYDADTDAIMRLAK